MSYMIDKVADIVIDTVVENSKKKLDVILEEKNLKKILRKSILDCNEILRLDSYKCVERCIVDKESIEALNKELIMPNLTLEKLEENLSDFFKTCIRTDDEAMAGTIRKYICHSYKLGVAGLISIGQVDEDVHNVEKTVRESEKKVLGKLGETQADIIKEIKRFPAQQLMFIDELDDSRVYCYISLQLIGDIDNHYLDELSSNIFAEYSSRQDTQGFLEVTFDFLCPVKQYALREYLEYLNEEFSKNDIGILGISSHY